VAGRPRANPLSKARQRQQHETQARLLAFLLEHGRSRVRGGHVALARGLARRGLVNVVDLKPGFAAEIRDGQEERAREFVAEHGVPDDPAAAAKRRLLSWSGG